MEVPLPERQAEAARQVPRRLDAPWRAHHEESLVKSVPAATGRTMAIRRAGIRTDTGLLTAGPEAGGAGLARSLLAQEVR